MVSPPCLGRCMLHVHMSLHPELPNFVANTLQVRGLRRPEPVLGAAGIKRPPDTARPSSHHVLPQVSDHTFECGLTNSHTSNVTFVRFVR